MSIKSVKRLTEESGIGIGLKLVLSDGSEFKLNNELLRKECPCASCLDKKGQMSHEKPLGGRASLRVVKATLEESLDIKKIWALGNYAIGMLWSDGHDSGIYTYLNLEKLAREQNATNQ